VHPTHQRRPLVRCRAGAAGGDGGRRSAALVLLFGHDGAVRRVGVFVLVIVCCLGAVPASAVPAHGAVSLRVLSFNMHTGIGGDGRLDLARTAATIREAQADVVALQEVDVHWDSRSDFRDQARELAGTLRMRVFFAPIYDLAPLHPGAPRRQYGVAVLSRFPFAHTANHEITRLSTLDPNAVPAPAPGFAEVEVAGIRVFVTHLDYRPDPAVRATQVADMLRIMPCGRKILLGDFNAPPEAPELAPLWRELRAAPTGFTFPADVPAKKIDYVTVSPDIRVRSSTALETLASDHRPVLADVSVPR
jgi:endonuclease/exonuclease/phosphatase family metal-dependent hydrolase